MTAEMRAGTNQPGTGASRWAPRVAWAVTGLYGVAAAAGLALLARAHAAHAPADVGMLAWLSTSALDALTFSAFVLAGAVIVTRRPTNLVGWLMVGAGLSRGVRLVAASAGIVLIGGSPADAGGAGLAAALVLAAFEGFGFQLAVWFLPLLYPDGHLPSRRWRPVLWVITAVTAIWAVGSLTAERLTGQVLPVGSDLVEVYDVANPLAVEVLQPLSSVVTSSNGGILFAMLLLMAVAAIATRFRGSRGDRRRQMKWLVFAVSITLSLLVLDLLLRGPLGVPRPVALLADGLVLLSVVLYPVAIGVAVLRYRLYEIDRIVSRTVTYGLVVAVLAAVYAGAVVGLGAAATAVVGTEDSDLVVAVATLLAAGLFHPVRDRIQTRVDRRFNRTGYAARQAVEEFARDIRDEVDQDRIRRRAEETAAIAVQPTHASVWLVGEHIDH